YLTLGVRIPGFCSWFYRWCLVEEVTFPCLSFSININTRIANEKYLRSHKEVELLLSGFLRTPPSQLWLSSERSPFICCFRLPSMPRSLCHMLPGQQVPWSGRE
uniref:Uncharacterized protein n=1 Tax=Gopherus evgoodei TaxID=1825980 RepID=A0A8C4YHZ1_9SAUR